MAVLKRSGRRLGTNRNETESLFPSGQSGPAMKGNLVLHVLLQTSKLLLLEMGIYPARALPAFVLPVIEHMKLYDEIKLSPYSLGTHL